MRGSGGAKAEALVETRAKSETWVLSQGVRHCKRGHEKEGAGNARFPCEVKSVHLRLSYEKPRGGLDLGVGGVAPPPQPPPP